MHREPWIVKASNVRPSHGARFTARGSRFLAPLILSALAASPARADIKFQQVKAFPRTQVKEAMPVSRKLPVLLSASQVDYDQKNDIVTASGKVEIAQGDTIVLADKVIYDQKRNIVTAIGHISMLEPSGNVYFADRLELKDDLKAGVVKQFKARLSDDSRFVAAGARKIDEMHTEVLKAAYTPCNCLLSDGQPKTPIWQIDAGHALIDQQKQEIVYRDVYFDVYGVPVFYSPYFSHPTPGANNQSGLLTPSFMQSTNLGAEYRQPVYYSIAPDKDITLTPIFTSLAGEVLAGQYRQKFDAGPLQIDGSITDAPNTNGAGSPIPGHQIRGHINAVGTFAINDQFDWGLSIRRSTDDTYLHLYNFSEDPLLTSRVYGEGFNFIGDSTRNYASIQALSFQDQTGQANPKTVPVIAPLTDFTWQSNPGIYNSRVLLDADAMSLYRQSGDESRRLSGTAGWKLPYLSADGEVIELNATMRTDLYDVNSVPLPDGQTFNGITGREMPQLSLLWHYPFINRFGTSSVMIEPVIEADASTAGGDTPKIPNEDSNVPEFNDSNLFSPNRFAGLDRVENGGGVSYGLRGQAQLFSDKYIDWLLGQHYRLYSDTAFPFSDDPSSRFSDYVGRVGLNYQPFTLAYRFRFDHETFAATRSEVDAGFMMYPVSANLSYLSLRNDPILATRETITGNSTINLTKEWAWTASESRDLLLGQTDAITTGLIFKNECVSLTTVVGKDFTYLQDIKPALTFWFQVSLKNLE